MKFLKKQRMDDQAKKRKSESMHDNVSLIDLASDSVDSSPSELSTTPYTHRYKRINNNNSGSNSGKRFFFFLIISERFFRLIFYHFSRALF